MRRRVVAVIGPRVDLGESVLSAARELGRLAVEAGFRVVTGGLDGVMAEASAGAREAPGYQEGDVMGVLPTYDAATANPHVDIVIPTGLGIARNIVVVASADVVIAIGGGSGTLTELAVAWQLGKPIVALQGTGWAGRLAGHAIDDRRSDTIATATTPDRAIELARALMAPG